MDTKIATWLMAAGAIIGFAGLCMLPAAFGAEGDRTVLGVGSVVTAMGLLLISGGFYVKARALGPAPAPKSATASAKSSRSKAVCDQCFEDEPVIQCRVHQLHLCPSCLSKHYDFRSCAYVPSTRRGTSKSSTSAYSQASSG